ncbi:MAG: cycloisomerase [Rhodobacterales bacterium]|nr:cycloisomerase [Rhodobacterales bacterium]
MPMKIDRMTVHQVSVPVVSVRSHGVGDVSSAMGNVVLRLETSDGLVGWGEASPWPVFTGTAEGNAAALHVHLRPLVMGADPRRVGEILHQADRVLVGHPEAKAALEMALMDIVGKAAGLPVAELLGGRCRDSVPLSVSLADPDWGADRALLDRITADGVRIVKLKTGFADHAFDLMRLEALRADGPDDLRVRVDYNQGMAPHEALRRLRDVEAFAPDFIEQPVPAKDWAAMAHLRAAIDTPLMADESVFTVADAVRAVEHRIADLFSIKVMKCGGMRNGQHIAAVAQAGGLACYGGDMFETGLAHLAGLHMVAATPNISLGCEFYQATYYVAKDLLAEPFPIQDGRVMVPTAPGLGLDVDTAALDGMTVSRQG